MGRDKDYHNVQQRILELVGEMVSEGKEARLIYAGLQYAAAAMLVTAGMPKEHFLAGAGMAYEDAREKLEGSENASVLSGDN